MGIVLGDNPQLLFSGDNSHYAAHSGIVTLYFVLMLWCKLWVALVR